MAEKTAQATEEAPPPAPEAPPEPTPEEDQATVVDFALRQGNATEEVKAAANRLVAKAAEKADAKKG